MVLLPISKAINIILKPFFITRIRFGVKKYDFFKINFQKRFYMTPLGNPVETYITGVDKIFFFKKSQNLSKIHLKYIFVIQNRF